MDAKKQPPGPKKESPEIQLPDQPGRTPGIAPPKGPTIETPRKTEVYPVKEPPQKFPRQPEIKPGDVMTAG